MKKYIFFLILCTFFSTPALYAVEDIPKPVPSFDEFMQNTKNYCEGSTQEWAQNSSIVPVPQYPSLDADAINRQIDRLKNMKTLTADEQQKLINDLSASRIGLTAFATLEVARLQYRAAMNSLFACAVVESRLNILTKLRAAIPKNVSEILTALNKEEKSLQTQKNTLQCNSAGSDKVQVMQELVNSATKQYCYYRYYLDYLGTALETDKTSLDVIEGNIKVMQKLHDNQTDTVWNFLGNKARDAGLPLGTGYNDWNTIRYLIYDGWLDQEQVDTLFGQITNVPGNNTNDWIRSYNTYANALDTEIARADATLPSALRALRDMERTYPAHLLLVIIYDDYIRLRYNLSIYMNASTQLYMKAYNAQDANKR